MPYITQEARNEIIDGRPPEGPGELNFEITGLCNLYLMCHGLNYTTLNEIVGVLECAKLEFYRRMAVPYEDQKLFDNGDVYTESYS